MSEMKEKIYYWYCPVCKTEKEYGDSLQDVRLSLEDHEKQQHKKKLVGTFGKHV